MCAELGMESAAELPLDPPDDTFFKLLRDKDAQSEEVLAVRESYIAAVEERAAQEKTNTSLMTRNTELWYASDASVQVTPMQVTPWPMVLADGITFCVCNCR